jgi:hypothetical protein
MKLSTGDWVEIKVCRFPDEIVFLLNGLPYETVEKCIKAFLSSNLLFTHDLSLDYGDTVGIYFLTSNWKRLFSLFTEPDYLVFLDDSYTRRVCDEQQRNIHSAESSHQIELRVLAEVLEKLVARPFQEQICTIYH